MRADLRLALALTLAPALLVGQERPRGTRASLPTTSFTVKPSLLDTKDGAGTVLGAEYNLAIDWKHALASDRGSASIDPDATIFRVGLSGSADGTLAIDKRRNPKNFSEGKLELAALWSTPALSVSLGGHTKFETDQSFQNKSLIIGGNATGAACWGLTAAGCFVVYAAYDNVDPRNDVERAAVLGPNPSSYKRINLELLVKQQLQWKTIQGLELDYRLFQELNAPTQVRTAKIDAFALGTARIDLPSDLFVAYSVGKLPFDRKDDAIVQLGWSYKLR